MRLNGRIILNMILGVILIVPLIFLTIITASSKESLQAKLVIIDARIKYLSIALTHSNDKFDVILSKNIPHDYKSYISKYFKEMLFDPYTVRSVHISIPFVVGGLSVVCSAFNAKNMYGAYSGRTIYVHIFEENRLAFSDNDIADALCSRHEISDNFPELGPPD